MSDIIRVDIIENDKGGHKNLLFSIDQLLDSRAFDTYYFALAIEPKDTREDIKKAIAEFMEYWKEKIANSKANEMIYLPIDFSDQYTGCLRVHKINDELTIVYGYSMIEGWSVSPLDPSNYYNAVSDFQPDSDRQLIINEKDFILDLERQINKLKGDSTEKDQST